VKKLGGAAITAPGDTNPSDATAIRLHIWRTDTQKNLQTTQIDRRNRQTVEQTENTENLETEYNGKEDDSQSRICNESEITSCFSMCSFVQLWGIWIPLLVLFSRTLVKGRKSRSWEREKTVAALSSTANLDGREKEGNKDADIGRQSAMHIGSWHAVFLASRLKISNG